MKNKSFIYIPTFIVILIGSFIIIKDTSPPIDKTVVKSTESEESKKTLLGIDSDKDGVRDDVQLWIQSHPLSGTDAFKILYRIAQLYQEEIKTIIDDGDSVATTRLRRLASGCFLDTKIGTSSDETVLIDKQLTRLVFNTRARKHIKERIGKNYDGQVTSYLSESECRSKFLNDSN